MAGENPFDDAPSTTTTATYPPSTTTANYPPSTTTATSPPPSSPSPDSILTVDRNATLTLGTDALILLDEALRHRRQPRNCCGLVPRLTSSPTTAIPFHHILWASLVDQDREVEIQYARANGKTSCAVAKISYGIGDKSAHPHARRWVEKLLERAYPEGVKREKRIKVLINPFGGQGYAQKIWAREVEGIFAAARCKVDVERTAYRGHAVEIGEKLDVDAYDAVACASGDGLPHEVWNGLAKQKMPRRALRKVAVVQIPCGSGNALSLNFNGTDSPSWAAVEIIKGVRSPFDLVAITQGSQQYYSFLSQAVGLIAESDLGTEALRWMGPLRFTWGALVRLLSQSQYPATLSLVIDNDDKAAIKSSYRHALAAQTAARTKNLSLPTDTDEDDPSDSLPLPPLRYGTIQDPLSSDFVTEDLPTLGNFYAGNMCYMSPSNPFFPTSLPSDGRLDVVNISGLTPRLRGLAMLLSVENATLIDFPEVAYRKVLAYRILPRVYEPPRRKAWLSKVGRWLGGAGKQREGLIAVDGERVAFEGFQAEVQEGLGVVLCRRRGVYEFEGLPGEV